MTKILNNDGPSRFRAFTGSVPSTSAWAFVAAGLVVSMDGGQAIAAEPELTTLGWSTDLEHFQVDSDKFVGQRFSFRCPELTKRTKGHAIYGTNVYSSDSPICWAALHAGAVSRSGGRVTVQLNPGAKRYTGRKQNGLTSRDRPATKRSMVFVGASFAEALTPIQREYAPRVKWKTKFTATGLANRKLVGQRFVFKCPKAPANLRGRRVYGTDHYAFNSLICLAAVHAGRLTRGGGFVTVQLVEPAGKLVSSTRHGIESKSGAAGNRQIVFLKTVASTAKAAVHR